MKDWPESIANAWIDFERDEGTLEQMEICETKTKEKLDKVNEERQKSQQFSNPQDIFSQAKKAAKRKVEETGKMRKSLGISHTKIARTIEQEKPKPKLRESILNFDKQGESSKKIEPPPGFEKTEEKMEEDLLPEVDEKLSVFVSNLDYTATEEDVKEALSSAGPITLIRIVRKYTGQSKGFCYVQFSSPVGIYKFF